MFCTVGKICTDLKKVIIVIIIVVIIYPDSVLSD